MTFYESNKDVHDTGAEVAEFDDAPPDTKDDDESDVEQTTKDVAERDRGE